MPKGCRIRMGKRRKVNNPHRIYRTTQVPLMVKKIGDTKYYRKGVTKNKSKALGICDSYGKFRLPCRIYQSEKTGNYYVYTPMRKPI